MMSEGLPVEKILASILIDASVASMTTIMVECCAYIGTCIAPGIGSVVGAIVGLALGLVFDYAVKTDTTLFNGKTVTEQLSAFLS